jgi:hypothetical protein
MHKPIGAVNPLFWIPSRYLSGSAGMTIVSGLINKKLTMKIYVVVISMFVLDYDLGSFAQQIILSLLEWDF